MSRVHTMAFTGLLLSLVASAGTAQARSGTHQLHLGIGFNASSSASFDDGVFNTGNRQSGSGAVISLGYNFTPRWGTLISITGADLSGDNNNSYTLSHMDLAVRHTWADTTRALVPYGELAISPVVAWAQRAGQERELVGYGFIIGVGTNYFFARRFAVDAVVRYAVGKFTDVWLTEAEPNERTVSSLDQGLGLRTARLNLGVSCLSRDVDGRAR